MGGRKNLEWESMMQKRIRSLTAKSVNGYTRWIDRALHEFNFSSSPYYIEHKELMVEYGFCNN